tara:strand:+ start:1 stop:906 length:906 start_codon:yes stop_codon:yes gene_type:complete
MCTKSRICQEFNNTFEYLKFKEIGFSSLNLIIKEIGGNFYHLNFILSILFIFPILSFCSSLKRPFLAILVSYPYLITVIGLGTVRQSISIAFLMLCIKQLKNYRFYNYYLYSLISLAFHYSSIFFLFLPILIPIEKDTILKTINKYLYILFIVLITVLIFFKDNYFINNINRILFYTNQTSLISPLLIWVMIAFPAAIILLNYKKFKVDDENKFWRNFSIIGILMIFPIFINTTIALRFLLYFIPIKIYCLSNLPNIGLFKISIKNTYFIIIFLSFSILTIWLNFANHSYCYTPYKNLLLK